jgi:hypothetical protein
VGDPPSEYPGWVYVDARHSLASLVFIGDDTAVLLCDWQSSVSGPHQDLCAACTLHVSGELFHVKQNPSQNRARIAKDNELGHWIKIKFRMFHVKHLRPSARPEAMRELYLVSAPDSQPGFQLVMAVPRA